MSLVVKISFIVLLELVCLYKNYLGNLWYLVEVSLFSMGKLINNIEFKFIWYKFKFLKIRLR